MLTAPGWWLQNKEAKAVVLTSTHVLYLDLARQRIRWHFSLANLTSVSTTGAQPPCPRPCCPAASLCVCGLHKAAVLTGGRGCPSSW